MDLEGNMLGINGRGESGGDERQPSAIKRHFGTPGVRGNQLAFRGRSCDKPSEETGTGLGFTFFPIGGLCRVD
jgi:hypothetical protein